MTGQVDPLITVRSLSSQTPPLHVRAKAHALFFWQQEWCVDEYKASRIFTEQSEAWKRDEIRKASCSLGSNTATRSGHPVL